MVRHAKERNSTYDTIHEILSWIARKSKGRKDERKMKYEKGK